MSVADSAPVLLWDTEAIAAEARDILRMEEFDRDADRVLVFANTATWLIEGYVEPAATWEGIPDPMSRAAALVTVWLYRQKDAPFGVLNAWSPDDYGPVRVGSDWLTPVKYLLVPYKAGWGIG